MQKDSFFDTSVVIHYASFSIEISHDLNKRCYNCIQCKKGNFIICRYVEDEIYAVVSKRKIIHNEVITKLLDAKYVIGNSQLSKELSQNDIAYAKKLYENFKDKTPKEVFGILLSERVSFEMRIDQFLKSKVDEKLIPTKDISEELVNLIRETISDYADCKVLASALQAQLDKNLFFFVTADSHFDKSGYEFMKEDSRFKKYKFPELKNMLFEK